MRPLPVVEPGAVVARRKPHESTNLAKLSERHLLAAQLVAWGTSNRRVAQEIGVAEETVSRWRHSALFLEAVAKEVEILVTHKRTRMEREQQATFDDAEDMREAFRAGRDELVKQLSAEDSDGNALLGVRQGAARILKEMASVVYDDKVRTSEYAEKKSSTVDVKVAVGSVWNVYPDRIEPGDIIDAEVEEDADRD